MKLDAMQRRFLIEGIKDYVGLWEYASVVREAWGDMPLSQICDVVLGKVEPLLRNGLCVAGNLKEDGGFAEWDGGVERALERMRGEWHQLGRDPHISDICWFMNTEAGDRAAEALVREGSEGVSDA